MNILIAEDDAISRRFLTVLLGKMGHTVTACDNARTALEAYRQGDFRTIISDWMMPEMSGLDLCRAVRDLGRQPRCYVLIATARIGEHDERKVMAAGADGYLLKPINKDEIETTLRLLESVSGGC